MINFARRSTLFGITISSLVVLCALCSLSQERILAELKESNYIEKSLSTIRNWSRDERESHEIYAVASGAAVSMSSYYSNDHNHYELDSPFIPQTWAPAHKKLGQWIEVAMDNPVFWTDVIVQGRGDLDYWTTGVKIAFSVNGKFWDYLEGGKVFEANNDRTTKVLISFDFPVYARVVRIYPVTWYVYPQLRFEAIYVDLNRVS